MFADACVFVCVLVVGTDRSSLCIHVQVGSPMATEVAHELVESVNDHMLSYMHVVRLLLLLFAALCCWLFVS